MLGGREPVVDRCPDDRRIREVGEPVGERTALRLGHEVERGCRERLRPRELEAVDGRPDTAKLEAAHAAKTAGIEAFEDRCMGTGPRYLTVGGQHVPATEIRTLVNRPVLVEFEVELREIEVAEELLERDIQQASFGRTQVRVAAVARDSETQAGQEMRAVHLLKERGAFNLLECGHLSVAGEGNELGT